MQIESALISSKIAHKLAPSIVVDIYVTEIESGDMAAINFQKSKYTSLELMLQYETEIFWRKMLDKNIKP